MLRGLCNPNRWRKLSTLEFDRDRKSMSVICAPAQREATPSASHQGVQTRRSARAGSVTNNGAGANVLLVKGAAECLLARSTRVRSSTLGDADSAHHALASRVP